MDKGWESRIFGATINKLIDEMSSDNIPAIRSAEMSSEQSSEGRVLLIVGGGIAAYKSLELIRKLRGRGINVRVVLTAGGAKFVTPLSLAAVSGNKVFEDLFSPTEEAEIGHIQLSRASDLVVVAPATADLMARMAAGVADDLATALLLAGDKQVLLAPAMNVRMWHHPATQRNVERLKQDGAVFVGPGDGDMACGEFGLGRMSEPEEIVEAVGVHLARRYSAVQGRLAGLRMIVTAGPTYEPLDPVRFIGNRSSGKQGYAIALAAARAGADVVLVSGPTVLATPFGVQIRRVETALQMHEAVKGALPADIYVGAAAVADWRAADVDPTKTNNNGSEPPIFRLVENPDILAYVAALGEKRPRLVVGFAAETESLDAHARAKLHKKKCDLVVANDVAPTAGTFGGENNVVHLIGPEGVEVWPRLSKAEVGARLIERFASMLGTAR